MPDDFRITFFFGPDESSERPDVVVCVFNVKKRSWKGGVQVAVELYKQQLARVADQGQLDELIEMIRAKIESANFSDYEHRARDLFTQQLCWMKLDLAIARGLNQENQTIPAATLVEELDREAPARAGIFRERILTELDL